MSLTDDKRQYLATAIGASTNTPLLDLETAYYASRIGSNTIYVTPDMSIADAIDAAVAAGATPSNRYEIIAAPGVTPDVPTDASAKGVDVIFMDDVLTAADYFEQEWREPPPSPCVLEGALITIRVDDAHISLWQATAELAIPELGLATTNPVKYAQYHGVMMEIMTPANKNNVGNYGPGGTGGTWPTVAEFINSFRANGHAIGVHTNNHTASGTPTTFAQLLSETIEARQHLRDLESSSGVPLGINGDMSWANSGSWNAITGCYPVTGANKQSWFHRFIAKIFPVSVQAGIFSPYCRHPHLSLPLFSKNSEVAAFCKQTKPLSGHIMLHTFVSSVTNDSLQISYANFKTLIQTLSKWRVQGLAHTVKLSTLYSRGKSDYSYSAKPLHAGLQHGVFCGDFVEFDSDADFQSYCGSGGAKPYEKSGNVTWAVGDDVEGTVVLQNIANETNRALFRVYGAGFRAGSNHYFLLRCKGTNAKMRIGCDWRRDGSTTLWASEQTMSTDGTTNGNQFEIVAPSDYAFSESGVTNEHIAIRIEAPREVGQYSNFYIELRNVVAGSPATLTIDRIDVLVAS